MSHSLNNPSSELSNTSKLNLDMSFNRHPQGRFACDVDPLSLQLTPLPPPTPTFADFEPSQEELVDALCQWSFPIRTDYARGLIWGPYKHSRGNSWSSELDNNCLQLDPSLVDPSNQQQYSSDHLLDIPVPQHSELLSHHQTSSSNEVVSQQSSDSPTQQLPQSTRLQKIFPILRSPIVIRIKPLSAANTLSNNPHNPLKRRRQSSRIGSLKSPFSLPRILHFDLPSPHHQPKKHRFVQVAFSVESMNPSRIKLCPNSRLKYTN